MPIEVVDVPEWGGTVGLRVMSGAERERFEAVHLAGGNKADVRARLVVLTACDGDGNPLFGEGDVEHLRAAPRPLVRLFPIALAAQRPGLRRRRSAGKKLRRSPLRLFAFRLARRMGCTVGELLGRIDSRELSEWIAFERVEPYPDPFYLTGLVCATLVNVVNALAGSKARAGRQFIPGRARAAWRGPARPWRRRLDAMVREGH